MPKLITHAYTICAPPGRGAAERREAQRQRDDEPKRQKEPPTAAQAALVVVGIVVQGAKAEEDPVIEQQVRHRQDSDRRVGAERRPIDAHEPLRNECQRQEPQVTNG